MAMAGIVLTGSMNPVRAGLLDTLQKGLNEYEDLSREHVFFNGNPSFNVGSVVAGFSQISEQTTPSPGVSMNNTLYAVFAVQVGSATTVGGNTVVSFIPVNAALHSTETLSALTGKTINGNAMVAFFDKPQGSPFSQNYVTPASPPSGIGAYLSQIASNSGVRFDLSAGFAKPSTKDFFTATTSFPLAAQTPAALNATPSSVTISSYFGGLSILDNNTGFLFNDSIVGNDGNTHQFGILRGTTSGASDDPFDPSYGNYGGDAGVQDNASFEVNVRPALIVPEPVTLMSLAAFALLAGGKTLRRRIAAC
jgi:hypothetical protein